MLFIDTPLLGSKAEDAIPSLAILMNDTTAPNSAERAKSVLFVLRFKLIHAQMALMTNNSWWGRQESITMLGFSETPVGPALPVLARCLQDTNACVAAAAAEELGLLYLDANLSVPALEKSLRDTRPAVRKAAIQALSRFQAQARPAVPALLTLLEDPDRRIRNYAAKALDSIDPEALERDSQ